MALFRSTVLALSLLALGARAQTSESPAADEVEAAQLSSSDAGPSLRLYGFADATYQRYVYDRESAWSYTFPARGSFSVGHLNLFLDGQLSSRARSLVELRFTYLPGGAPVGDYTQNLARTAVGGAVIERAWVEYAFSDLLTARAGQFLTPYGVWNVDHGSPTLIDVFPPYVITQQLFPTSQQGLELYGARQAGAVRVGYHLTVSNGRSQSVSNDWVGANKAWVSNDHRLGYGGHAFLETRALGELRIGGSFYTGRYTEGEQAGPDFKLVQQYDEVALGLDARWQYKNLLVVGEALMQNVAFTRDGRAALAATLGQESYDDYVASGWYLLAGYRLPWGQVTPFAMVQRHVPNDNKARQSLWAVTGGVNVRLLPSLVLKASLTKPVWPDAAPANVPYSQSLVVAGAQIAWAF